MNSNQRSAIITSELRALRGPDGSVYTSAAQPYSFWERYLQVFSSVTVLARVKPVPEAPARWLRADGPNVQFIDLPYYVGPLGYVKVAGRLRSIVRAALGKPGTIIFRVPSNIASVAFNEVNKGRRPFGLEVVGDPWESLAPGSSHHPLRAVFRRIYTHRQWQLCRAAAGIAYVTESTLQGRSPAPPKAFTTHYSDIELGEEAFVAAPRCARPLANQASLVTVASLEQPYKGIDLLLHAVSVLRAGG